MGMLLLAAAGFARLGVWQLGRLDQRRAANRTALAARAAPPARVDGNTGRLDTLVEHRVIVHGRYDHGHEIVVRGDVLQGVPGVRLVTPLLLAPDGPAVLVDRGFLPAPDALTVDASGAGEPGEREVRGIALRVPTGPRRADRARRPGHLASARPGRACVAGCPTTCCRIVVKQSPDSALPRFPRRLDPAPLDQGPHLAYAVQWFLFAGLAAAFAVLVVGRSGRRAP